MRPGSHLDILDPIPIGIIVTLVPHTIIVSIFLPRVGCQKAVVLKCGWGRIGSMSPGLAQSVAPHHLPPTSHLPQHLLAVLVVVHAGQGLVRVAVYVCVGAAHVPIPCPAHVALGQHKGGWGQCLCVCGSLISLCCRHCCPH